MDEYGCLRKGNKAPLVERLGVKLQLPDVVIVDAQQLMYHVIWPCGWTVESLNARLAMCGPAEKILVFDRYDDHERQRRAGVGSSTVLLVFWTWRYGSQDKLVVQMENWNGVVLDINATCASLGQALCSQLLGAHALIGCDTVLFPFGKGKISKRRQLPRVAWCPWWGGCHAGGSHGNSSSKRYTDGHPAGIFSNLPTASCSWRKMDLE